MNLMGREEKHAYAVSTRSVARSNLLLRRGFFRALVTNLKAGGTRQGRNDFGKIGYAGPCGPHGSTHRYFFDLFALNSTLDLPAGATRAQIEDAMNTHVLARGKLMARYRR